ncbi:MAG: ATP phosphoribosyltransferase [Firmicutes bacterium]|nr:ATP phosphoribosyltransferase [Bacillota bacterium]MDI6705544.1 ATP phosphoribosyltransferase [Bacillota bacterium]
MDRFIRIALAKGRIASQSKHLFEKIGMDCSQLGTGSRKLIVADMNNRVEFILVKANDVTKYVEQGAVDMGVVGKDTLLEQQPDLFEVLDLGIGRCRMVVAGKSGYMDGGNDAVKVVATKYPVTAQRYFREKGENIRVVKLDGSVELAPLVGLSHVIVDLVETGRTLRDNGLVILEEICPISARLVVNKVSLKMENERITGVLKALREVLRKAG